MHHLKIDRTKFDVRYGSTSFFDGLKDKAIYDEFDLVARFRILIKFTNFTQFNIKKQKIMIYKKQDRPMCGCGNTQDPNGYCDGSHLNK